MIRVSYHKNASIIDIALPSWLIDMSRQPSFNLIIGKKSDITRMCDGEYLPVSKQVCPRLKQP